MTWEEAKQLRALKNEIRLLEKRIEKLEDKDGQASFDSVKGSTPSFPFISRRYIIKGFVYNGDQIERLSKILDARHQAARELIEQIETWISEIQDSEIRQIAELYFVDGVKVRDIPALMGVDGDGTTQHHKLKRYVDGMKVSAKSAK
jgi:hypothetical protein